MKTQITNTLTERTFGIEIEFLSAVPREYVTVIMNQAGIKMVHVESYSQAHSTDYSDGTWKCVSDGSVRNGNGHNGLTFHRGYVGSCEVVSPILKGAEGLAEVRKVCDVLNNSDIKAKVNKSCGLHVHHGAEDFTEKNLKNVFYLYKAYEDELDQLVSPSRRKNNAYFCEGFKLQNRDYFKMTKFDRYYKVNLDAYARHCTVEIRHMNGTTDADKICGWTVFTQAIIERSVHSTQKVKELDNMFQGFQMYRNSGLFRNTASEEKKAGMTVIMKQIRKWATERKVEMGFTA